MIRADRVHYSFILDRGVHFAYEGWHLARSLRQHCQADPASIHVQVTPEVDERTRAIFRDEGYTLHHLARFGDGRYCNKLGQLDNLGEVDFDVVALLDTDTIAIADLSRFVDPERISGKVVDIERPPTPVLDEIWAEAGLAERPPLHVTDAVEAQTYHANCNGGFYAVPKHLAARLSAAWQLWALWLLDHMGPLERAGRQNNVDQISFCLAVNTEGLPFVFAPSNANYFVHIDGPHRHHDPARPIALVHYHAVSWDVLGKLAPNAALAPEAAAAVAAANEQIGTSYDNRLFWDLRYGRFLERGSGVGSRGENLLYKRALLREQGVEEAESVLDVGCGDLEVLRDLQIRNYLGLDQSPVSLDVARNARPDWSFRLAPAPDVAPADMVLCFEVLIHQKTPADYRGLIDFLAAKTGRSLLVSGFDAGTEGMRRNPMVCFHEPLEESLRRTGRFREIRRVGGHTNVSIYRCDV